MANETKTSQAQEEILKSVKEIVSERVSKNVETLLKLGSTKIDEKAIEKKCSEELFRELDDFMAGVSKNVDKFFALLKGDDPVLYAKVEEKAAEGNEAIKKVTNLQELIEYGKEKRYDDETLDKVYTIGARYYSDGDFDNAFLYFSWLCLVDGDNPQMWFMKGVVELNLKKYDRAVASFYEVVNIDPGFIKVYTQLMNCLILMGDLPIAKNVYDAFTRDIDPRSYEDDSLFTENMSYIKKILQKQ